jgi:hypothetical protein
VRERNSNILIKVRTEPNLLILFLNFLDKTKSKDLAANGNAVNLQVSTRPALHIGVVSVSLIIISLSLFSVQI